MKRLTVIAAAAVLLVTPIPAKAEPTFLVCAWTGPKGAGTWNISLNEAASTVSLTSGVRTKTTLGGFSPESVTWSFVSGGGDIGELRQEFRLNRLTGEIKTQSNVPSSWSKKSKERVKALSASGVCKLRQAPTKRMF